MRGGEGRGEELGDGIGGAEGVSGERKMWVEMNVDGRGEGDI